MFNLCPYHRLKFRMVWPLLHFVSCVQNKTAQVTYFFLNVYKMNFSDSFWRKTPTTYLSLVKRYLSCSNYPRYRLMWAQYISLTSCSTVRCLGVLSGPTLLGMTREELKMVCPEEGGRVFFQLQAVKSTITASYWPQRVIVRLCCLSGQVIIIIIINITVIIIPMMGTSGNTAPLGQFCVSTL